MAFEDFWLNVATFRGLTINQKFRDEPIEQRRRRAARAFEMWRNGLLDIDYDTGELLVRCVRS